MSEKKEESKGWTRQEKALGIIAIILVGGVFLFASIPFENLQFDAWNTPIEMTEPARTFQCQQTLEEYIELKNFLGIDDSPTPEQITEMSWSDYEYYTKLQLKLAELKCSIEPDT